MRLKPYEVRGIINAINSHLSLQQAELRLFGSRAKADTKGGDIDLLLVLSDEKEYQDASSKKVAIIIEIHKNIGEQKIDMVVAQKKDLNEDPFLKLIYPHSLVLCSW